ncbi:hypothetical protein AAU57_05715 [Nonlabens sp. YIK11]|uniref:CHAT domain-containing protein n=1 Tax=Nonlabens sp. YIK11 TaxID=1453349 RepID=UPI0006DC36E6|nr:CHAT domain-containing protein [Nonlabens sp. YIK11]KQC32866.1 hypothetical protein AAU57_05715 [Nonlabens sp. YIK11]
MKQLYLIVPFLFLLAGCNNGQEAKKEKTIATRIKKQQEIDSASIELQKKYYDSGLSFYNEQHLDSSLWNFEKAYENRDLRDSTSTSLYAQTTFYLDELYTASERIQEREELVKDFLNNINGIKHIDPTSISSMFANLSGILQRAGKYQQAIDNAILPNANLIDQNLSVVNDPELKAVWETLRLTNMRNHLMAITELSDSEEEKKVASLLEKTLSNTEKTPILEDRLFMIYDPLFEYYIDTGAYKRAEALLLQWKEINIGKPIIEQMILEDKYLRLANAKKDPTLAKKSRDQVFEYYAQVDEKFYYHDHYYVKALNDILLQENFVETNPYKKLDSIGNIIIQKTNQNAVNIYTNPLSVYNSKVHYFDFKKQADSMLFYIDKHFKLATELNHNYELLKHLQNKSDYYILIQDADSHNKSILNYLKDKGIESIDKLNKEETAQFNSSNLLIHSHLAENSYNIFKKKNNLESLKIAHNLWMFNLKMLNSFRKNGRYSIGQKEILLKTREGVLLTFQDLKNYNLTNSKTSMIELLEDSYSLELVIENLSREIVPSPQMSSLNKLRKSLMTEVQKLKLELDSVSNNSKLKKYNASLTTIDSVVNAMTSINPVYASIYSRDFKLSEFQQKLKKRDLFRVYQTDSLFYPVLISSNSLDFQTPIKKDQLLSLSKSLRNQIRSKEPLEETVTQLKDLYNLKSFENDLVVITEGAMTSIPMELILDRETNIVHAPSINAYQTSYLSHETTTNSFVAYSPSYNSVPDNPVSRDIERSGNYMLPYAIEESKFISNLFDGELMTRTDATKKNFKDTAKHYNLHHLAMHAVVDEGNSRDAKLLFYGDKEDDYMNLDEIYNLDLNSNLVTLSACNTAYGKVDPIEGVMSLSRAFQYAGARATLTSLWRVPDRETSIIMKSFYTHLKNGDHKDVALKKAKQDYLNAQVEEELKHPYYWAGFIITGDVSPITSPFHWWHYALGIFLMLGIFFILRGLLNRSKT